MPQVPEGRLGLPEVVERGLCVLPEVAEGRLGLTEVVELFYISSEVQEVLVHVPALQVSIRQRKSCTRVLKNDITETDRLISHQKKNTRSYMMLIPPSTMSQDLTHF